MDIEGFEWDVFSSINSTHLNPFDQILVEVHHLSKLKDYSFAEKVIKSLTAINRKFTLFHVYANNCGSLHFVGGMPVADVMELAFVRTSLVIPSPSTTFYPTLNLGNAPMVHDWPLLLYTFLPISDPSGAQGVLDNIMTDAMNVD